METKLTKEQALDILEKDLACRRDKTCIPELRSCAECEYGLNDYISDDPMKMETDVLEEAIAIAVNELKEEKEMNKNEEKMEKKETKETNVNALSPWAEYIHKLEALFGQDPEIKIHTDDSIPGIWLLIDNQDKADALAKLLPEKKTFGNVELKITVIPSNFSDTTERLIGKAFDKNPAFAFAKTIGNDVMSNNMTYAVFKPEVVQYWADNLGDIYGLKSTLYQDLAKDVFDEIPGLFYCTDKKPFKMYRDYQSYMNSRRRD